MINCMNKNLKYFLLVIFTFLYIYYPPIFPINVHHLLAGISWFVILSNYNKISRIFKSIRFDKEAVFLVILSIYLYFVLIFNNGSDIIIGYPYIRILTHVIPIGVVIVYWFSKNHSDKNFLVFIVHVGLLQSVISILALLNPSFQNWIIESMLAYGFDDIIEKLSVYRLYGMSYTMAYSMPIVQGIIASIAVYLSINKKFKYIFFVPFIIVSGAINARISIVIFLIGLSYILFNQFIQVRQGKKIVGLIIVVSLIFIFYIPLSNILNTISPSTYLWINEGFDQIF